MLTELIDDVIFTLEDVLLVLEVLLVELLLEELVLLDFEVLVVVAEDVEDVLLVDVDFETGKVPVTYVP